MVSLFLFSFATSSNIPFPSRRDFDTLSFHRPSLYSTMQSVSPCCLLSPKLAPRICQALPHRTPVSPSAPSLSYDHWFTEIFSDDNVRTRPPPPTLHPRGGSDLLLVLFLSFSLSLCSSVGKTQIGIRPYFSPLPLFRKGQLGRPISQ